MSPLLTKYECVMQAVIEELLRHKDKIEGDSGLRSIQMTVYLYRDPDRPMGVSDIETSLRSARAMGRNGLQHA